MARRRGKEKQLVSTLAGKDEAVIGVDVGVAKEFKAPGVDEC